MYKKMTLTKFLVGYSFLLNSLLANAAFDNPINNGGFQTGADYTLGYTLYSYFIGGAQSFSSSFGGVNLQSFNNDRNMPNNQY